MKVFALRVVMLSWMLPVLVLLFTTEVTSEFSSPATPLVTVATPSPKIAVSVPTIRSSPSAHADVQVQQVRTHKPLGVPTSVSIVRIGVEASIVPTGLDPDGLLVPPHKLVAWYNEPGWPSPGYPGASVLAGHINDTFLGLPKARVGDRIDVLYSTGDKVTFIITDIVSVSKRDLPTATIWSHPTQPVLRLITCDPGSSLLPRGDKFGYYANNIVVYADKLL